MNSFHYHQKLITKLSCTVALFMSSMILGANAQNAPLPSVNQQGESTVEERSLPALPSGATLDGAREKVSTLSSEAGKSLEKLMGGTVSPRIAGEVEAMADKKRSIMFLGLQVEEAKLAKELWLELEGDKNDQAQAELEQLKVENSELKISLENAQKAPPPSAIPAGIPVSPVVTEIIGAAGGMKASVYYPGAGVIEARPGVVLPNGMKVVSVSSGGVVVQDGSQRSTLGYGKATD